MLFSGDGAYVRATAGVEAHGCTARDTVCAVLGADGGVHRVQSSGTADTHLIVVPRGGLDMGWQTVRVRTTIDVLVDAAGGDGILGVILTVAVAHRW